jgi:predicted DNA-binding transcriptional regulator AlpA
VAWSAHSRVPVVTPEHEHEDDLIDFSACATVSLTEAAKVLGVHRSTAWDLYRRGEFPTPVLQVGHRLRVTKVHLRRYLLGGGP